MNTFFTVIRQVLSKSVPGQIVIQITNRCNGLCPQCGMRATEPFKRNTLSIDVIKRTIDHASVNGVSAISFTGGEPLLYFDELIELIQYAGKKGIPYIRTGTNGFFFKNHDTPDFKNRIEIMAERLAETPIRNFWISIDSSNPDVHEQMRGFPGIIDGIRKALPIFHKHGIYPSANLGINRNIAGNFESVFGSFTSGDRQAYLHRLHTYFHMAFHKFFQFVIGMGFTIVNACYPMSIETDKTSGKLNAVYSATSSDHIVNFDSDEKAVIYQALSEVIPVYRSKIRIFSPLCALHSLIDQHRGNHEKAAACRGGTDFLFIDAKDGNVYPCGYRGNESFGKYWEMKKTKNQQKTHCIQCDWECFRDPSELFSPLIDAVPNPFFSLRRLFRDPEFFHFWWSDIAYYYKCNFFNGRKPFNWKKHTLTLNERRILEPT